MSEKLYTVLMPNRDYTGYRHGIKSVLFEKGQAKVTKKEAIVFMRNFGYSCPELEEEKKGAMQKKGDAGTETGKKDDAGKETADKNNTGNKPKK